MKSKLSELNRFTIQSLSLFLLALIFSCEITCDIPVHCVKSQITGDWVLYATKAEKKTKDMLYRHSCSHMIPSTVDTSYQIIPDPSKFTKTYKVNLQNNNNAVLTIQNEQEEFFTPNIPLKGKWTMVYDEGFDILVEQYSFFAFSKYSPIENSSKKWNSQCYSTLVGWYHKDNYWGCFYAKKSGENPNEITNGEVDNKLLVVENTVQKASEDNFQFKQLLKQNPDEDDEDNDISFLEANSRFMYHQRFVNEINAMKTTWTAYNYEEFSKMTLSELNQYAGRKKISAHSHKGRGKFKLRMHKSLHKNAMDGYSRDDRDDKYKDLPKNFLKWKDYMPAPKSQGHCGSCYAVATTTMLEARLKIQTGKSEKLSVDHILKCSVYNQGCAGGYTYLVLKFGNEIEMIPSSCENKQNPCQSNCSTSYTVKDFGYLGGSYNQCDEEKLMRELMKNGPIVVSFEPDYLFMLYKTGIYKTVTDTWITKNHPRPQWEKVDHSVTLVGWGYDEEKREKYWLLLNSWGSTWGEDGYFKMVRGIDHMGIESICEKGNLIIKE